MVKLTIINHQLIHASRKVETNFSEFTNDDESVTTEVYIDFGSKISSKLYFWWDLLLQFWSTFVISVDSAANFIKHYYIQQLILYNYIICKMSIYLGILHIGLISFLCFAHLVNSDPRILSQLYEIEKDNYSPFLVRFWFRYIKQISCFCMKKSFMFRIHGLVEISHLLYDNMVCVSRISKIRRKGY